MNIVGTSFDITFKRNGSIATNIYSKSKGIWQDIEPADPRFADLEKMLEQYKSGTLNLDKVNELCSWASTAGAVAATGKRSLTVEERDILTSVMSGIQKFFTEFSFEPSYRFAHTFMDMNSSSARKTYITNYFELMDSPFLSQVKSKMESPEFKEILEKAKTYTGPCKKVNTRLKIYYGAQGNGKTTQAIKEAQVVMNCDPDIRPRDLMKGFEFVDGKAVFEKSDFYDALETGKTILLDEMRLLPAETLVFLQSVTDGKEWFNYDRKKVMIHPNFKIIGAMNHMINGMACPLPEPLIDRAEELVHYKLTAKNLVDSFEDF